MSQSTFDNQGYTKGQKIFFVCVAVAAGIAIYAVYATYQYFTKPSKPTAELVAEAKSAATPEQIEIIRVDAERAVSEKNSKEIEEIFGAGVTSIKAVGEAYKELQANNAALVVKNSDLSKLLEDSIPKSAADQLKKKLVAENEELKKKQQEAQEEATKLKLAANGAQFAETGVPSTPTAPRDASADSAPAPAPPETAPTAPRTASAPAPAPAAKPVARPTRTQRAAEAARPPAAAREPSRERGGAVDASTLAAIKMGKAGYSTEKGGHFVLDGQIIWPSEIRAYAETAGVRLPPTLKSGVPINWDNGPRGQ